MFDRHLWVTYLLIFRVGLCINFADEFILIYFHDL